MEFEGRQRIQSTLTELQLNNQMEEGLIYQLKRSKHRIEQLLAQNGKLRNTVESHFSIIVTQQEQLHRNELDRSQLQETISILMGELKQCRLRMALEQQRKQEENLQVEIEILRKRYGNCQEENLILRRQNKQKDEEIALLEKQKQLLKEQCQKLRAELERAEDQLDKCKITIDGLIRTNSGLERTLADLIKRQAHLKTLVNEYAVRLGITGQELNEAHRSQEGWFCELQDLRDTVEHIQELRDVVRIRKAIRECV